MAKVFISYAWENDAHIGRVREMADHLSRCDSLQVILDKYNPGAPEEGWGWWCDKHIGEADFTLLVCSTEYRKVYEGNKPLPGMREGISEEIKKIRAIFKENHQRNVGRRFAVILLAESDDQHVPHVLRDHARYQWPEQCDDLLAHLNSKNPVALAPPVVDPHVASNPYTPQQAIDAAELPGRESILRELRRGLDREQSVSLVGDWRIGKTSLLNVWSRQTRDAGRRVRVLTGGDPHTASCRQLVSAITGRQAVPGDADGAADVLQEWLKGDVLPGVVAIDRADKVLVQLPYPFFIRLRHLVEYRRLVLLLVSSRDLPAIYAEVNRDSPFQNLLQSHRLGLLESAGVDALIACGRSVLQPEDEQTMQRWAGRHPYYLQLLGYHLWRCRTDGLPVATAVDDFRTEAEKHLQNLWAVLTEREQQELRQILQGQPSDRHSLRQRGLTDNGQAFGEVLTAWMTDNV